MENNKNFKDQPIQLVTIDSNGTFEITYEGSNFLSSISENKVAVASLTGPYRSGKSFLANLIMNQMSGFKTGSTTNACTKGIWAWGRPCVLKDGTNLIILDSEGLGSVEKDREMNIDLKLFTLCVLISSTIIYNSKHSISEDKIEELANVANLSNRIKLSESKNNKDVDSNNTEIISISNFNNENNSINNTNTEVSELTDSFPKLIWVVRDFGLKLNELSDNDYLEKALSKSEANETMGELEGKNMSRDIIKKNFKERDCITMIIPSNDPKILKNLEYESRNNLRKEFVEKVALLINKIKEEKKVKSIKGIEIDGVTLLGIMHNYVEAINNNEVPVIMSSLESVLLAKTNKLQEAYFDKFRDIFLTTESSSIVNNKLTYQTESLELPLSSSEILNNYFENSNKLLLMFTKELSRVLSPVQVGNYLNNLLIKTQGELTNVLEQNSEYLDAWVDVENGNIARIINNTIKNNFTIKQEMNVISDSKTNNKNTNDVNYNQENIDIEIEKPEDLVKFCYLISQEFQTQITAKLKLFPDSSISKLFLKMNKLIEEIFFEKLRKISRSLNDIMTNELSSLNDEISRLNLIIKKTKDQSLQEKKLLEEIKKEKNELYTSKLELDSKFDNTLRELKSKEREFTNNLNTESQKYSRMESYYLNIIKEKNNALAEEEKKVAALQKEISSMEKALATKRVEFKKESSLLSYELEKIKSQNNKKQNMSTSNLNSVYNETSGSNISKGNNNNDEISQIQLQSIFKSLQALYIDFKELIEKSDKEKENIYKKKFFELSNKELDKRTLSINDEIKFFRDNHYKETKDSFESQNKNLHVEINELSLKIDQLELNLNEEKINSDNLKLKIAAYKKQMEELKNISNNKDSIIKTLKEQLSIAETKEKDYLEDKNNLEFKICELASGLKMKDDDLETAILIIESILSKNKRKYDNHIYRIDENLQQNIMKLVLEFKVFK